MRLAFPLVAILAAACSEKLELPWDRAGEVPLPHGFDPPAGPTVTPISDFGNGQDGDKNVAGTETVNDCASIASVASNGRVVTSPAPFADGDRVLLWQTQDAFASSGDAAPVANPGLAGLWQMARVINVDSDGIQVDVVPLPYVTDLAAGRSAQACFVPEYRRLDVGTTDRLAATPWSPATGGGVVAFFVSTSLDVAGVISATGLGYRGGDRHASSATASDVILLDTPSIDGGAKGYGLDGRSSTRFGRGNYANAGGGGNAKFAGGGGGGNAGSGGLGGRQQMNQGNIPETAGLPGSSVALGYPQRLIMGGGGGEGQCKGNGQGNCGAPGSGGGLVLVFARNLSGAGTFESDGNDVPSSNDDGGSGGGAGGTIVIRVEIHSFAGSAGVEGGRGGNEGCGDVCGPGGGGSGGRILLTGIDAIVARLAGGQPGFSNNMTFHFATPGSPGTVTVLPP